MSLALASGFFQLKGIQERNRRPFLASDYEARRTYASCRWHGEEDTVKEQDLAQLTVSELLDLAILAEEEAAQRYGEFAEQMEANREPQTAALFRQIQTREIEHLRRLREQRTRSGAESKNIEPLHFFDPAEATPYKGSSQQMTPTHVYQAVLQGEERACAFYQKLKEILSDSEAKELAHALWTEELRHVEWAARQLRNLPASPPEGK